MLLAGYPTEEDVTYTYEVQVVIPVASISTTKRTSDRQPSLLVQSYVEWFIATLPRQATSHLTGNPPHEDCICPLTTHLWRIAVRKRHWVIRGVQSIHSAQSHGLRRNVRTNESIQQERVVLHSPSEQRLLATAYVSTINDRRPYRLNSFGMAASCGVRSVRQKGLLLPSRHRTRGHGQKRPTERHCQSSTNRITLERHACTSQQATQG